MPLAWKIDIEEDGSVDFTLCIKQIVDWVLSNQKGPFEEGLQRINIKKTVAQIYDIMKNELPTNPMLDLEMDDPKVRDMCRITLKNILKNYGVSESWLRKCMPHTLKLVSHTNKRYLALPYTRKNIMIPDKIKRSFSGSEQI